MMVFLGVCRVVEPDPRKRFAVVRGRPAVHCAKWNGDSFSTTPIALNALFAADVMTSGTAKKLIGHAGAVEGVHGRPPRSIRRSALATLWAINNQASALLVTEFYRQLQDKDLSKAQALQRAQTKLMQNVRYRHPGYWSPFLLIGNWL